MKIPKISTGKKIFLLVVLLITQFVTLANMIPERPDGTCYIRTRFSDNVIYNYIERNAFVSKVQIIQLIGILILLVLFLLILVYIFKSSKFLKSVFSSFRFNQQLALNLVTLLVVISSLASIVLGFLFAYSGAGCG